MSTRAKVLWTVGICVVIGMIGQAFEARPARPGPSINAKPIGDSGIGVIDGGVGMLPVGGNEAVAKELASAAAHNDQATVAALIRSGDAFYALQGTPIRVVHSGIFSSDVRVVAGPMNGRNAYVPNEFLHAP